jgi:hypothetical protein
MAVAGGGVPGVKLALRGRKVVQVGLAHNVPGEVISSPQEAADTLALGNSCYVNSIAAKAWGEVWTILAERGLADPRPQPAKFANERAV